MQSLRGPWTATISALLLAAACGDDSAATSASAGETDDTTTTSGGSSSTTGGGTTTTSASTDPSGTGTESGGETGALHCDPKATVVGDQGLLLRDELHVGNVIDPCGAHRWYFVAPSASIYTITITAGDEALSSVIAYPDLSPSEALADPLESAASDPQEATMTAFTAPRSGEFAIYVAPTIAEAGATYAIEITCIDGCMRETTRFPMAFVHGWTGFETIGPLEYFYQVRDTLEPYGYPISIAVLDPYNSSEIRGAQLADQVDQFLSQWRARKVDLIGHSQGGVDSRYVISSLGYGDQVSVLMTIATPHRGTYITDLALGLAPGAVEVALAGLLNLLGAVTSQQKSDALASFNTLSEAYMVGEFNPENPDDPAVQYISYTGRTCQAIDFIDPKNQCDDLVDPLIGWSYDILKVARGPNDGLVTIESAQWGEYRGEMIADHIDEVGQIAGITDPDFDHKTWYLARVRDLVGDGH